MMAHVDATVLLLERCHTILVLKTLSYSNYLFSVCLQQIGGVASNGIRVLRRASSELRRMFPISSCLRVRVSFRRSIVHGDQVMLRLTSHQVNILADNDAVLGP